MTHRPVPSVVLVSQSPRRKDLLLCAGEVPWVCPSHADENAWAPAPQQQAQAIARQKLDALPASWAQDLGTQALHLPCLAADTLVVLQGEVLGKPHDAAHAKAMLALLSGRAHEVITGVALRLGRTESIFAVTTQVRFRPLTSAEIDAYVATGEPFDKAGGYGIQGLGGALVQEVHGSYTNVIGLPLFETLQALVAARCAEAR